MTVRRSVSRRTLLRVERRREAVSSGQWPAYVYSPLQVNTSFNNECSQHEAFRTRSGIINKLQYHLQGGSNMTGTDLYVNKPHCAAAV